MEKGSVRIPVRDHEGGFVWCKVSPPDYRLALRHRWRLDRDGYVVASVYDVGRCKSTTLPLHRLVCRAPHGVLVDHVRGAKLDCRRNALRFATHSQNSANRRSARDGRSSRYRGVTLHRTGRWQAQLKHADTNYYLGLFTTEHEAAAVYNKRARYVWGRFAVINRLPRTAAS